MRNKEIIKELKSKLSALSEDYKAAVKNHKKSQHLKQEILKIQGELKILEGAVNNNLDVSYDNSFHSDLDSDDSEDSESRVMALDSEKVITIITQILRTEYNGEPDGLKPFVKNLESIKESVSHKDNQAQAVKLILGKLTKKAESAVPDTVTTIDEIITYLRIGCKGKTVCQSKSDLNNLSFNNQTAFIENAKNIQLQLQTAYEQEGISRITAKKFSVSDVKEKMKDSFKNSIQIQTALLPEITEMDELVARFQDALNIHKQTEKVFHISRFKRNRGYRGGSSSSHSSSSFGSPSSFGSYNPRYQNQINFRGRNYNHSGNRNDRQNRGGFRNNNNNYGRYSRRQNVNRVVVEDQGNLQVPHNTGDQVDSE